MNRVEADQLYLNRELSLLEFQRRVLEEAQDENNPLLERVKFLAIFGSNMDEFFMVRVSGIRKMVENKIAEISFDGMSAREQLVAIRKTALELYDEAQQCYQRKLLPRLDKSGIHLLNYAKLSKTQKEKADAYFRNVVFPVLTPLALDPAHPFPHISSLSINLAILIRDPKGNEKFARIKVPDTLQRLVPLKRSSGSIKKDGLVPHHHYFVWLEQIIIANIDMLFPGMEVVSAHPFRIIRDADIDIQEIEADDLLESMQQSIRKRKFGSVVKVSIYESMPRHLREVLIDNLEVRPADVYVLHSHLGLSSLWQVYNNVERYDLKFPHYKPVTPRVFQKVTLPEDFYGCIREKNILLHHPYTSFDPVVEFLNIAARDPDVLAIKQTLYRVGSNAPVVEALLEAAERGKQVAVLVELKARFDEESNIGWARRLEQMGVHVVYGLIGLKTHSKIAMVVRREGEGIRRYVHLATGNYNTVSAKLYEDIGMFTCDEKIGEDATDLFNALTGYSLKQNYQKLLVAPVNVRQKLEKLIRREIEHARQGRPAHLILKANSIADKPVIDLLYEASRAGVQVDLLVRGICCLRPGLKNVSENIRVRSVVGRYLEHSRIFYFHNNGEPDIYIGSADLMTRNLSHRVEVLVPVEQADHVRYLSDVLNSYLKENVRTRIMQPNGTYRRIKPGENETPLDIQEKLMKKAIP